MKIRTALASAIFSASLIAFAQVPSSRTYPTHFVVIPAAQQTSIDLAETKMDDLNLRHQQLVESFEKVQTQMQKEYKQYADQMQSLLAAERKALGVPDTSVFTGTQPVAATATSAAKPAFAFEVPDKDGNTQKNNK